MAVDLLSVVEAAYQLGTPDAVWLKNLVKTIGPFMDRGMGVYGGTLDASDPARVRLGALQSYRGQKAMMAALRRGHDAVGEDEARRAERLYRSGSPILSVTEQIGGAEWEAISRNGPGGVGDCTALCALDASGRGCSVLAPSPGPQRHSPRVRRTWARVTAHIVAMQRLRTALPAAAERKRAEGEAVLSPGGKVEHAEGVAKERSARELLREAAIARERARGRMRSREPNEALEAWRALVAGRWSIVDRFDHDGRRYLIAHENEPSGAESRALTRREQQVVSLVAMGHSNKLIGYELGLTTGAIGGYLATAVRKLGLTSRTEVARLLRAAWMTKG